MAKYGLETETTVHLKGMQVDGFQSDTGGVILTRYRRTRYF